MNIINPNIYNVITTNDIIQMQSSKYSHNLALSLIDVEGDLSLIDIILEEIKAHITELPIIHSIMYNGTPCNVIMYWKKILMVPPFSNMMGDLFTLCPYPDDKIILSHTRQTIYDIETIVKEKYPNTRWCLIFHLTKIISDFIPVSS